MKAAVEYQGSTKAIPQQHVSLLCFQRSCSRSALFKYYLILHSLIRNIVSIEMTDSLFDLAYIEFRLFTHATSGSRFNAIKYAVEYHVILGCPLFLSHNAIFPLSRSTSLTTSFSISFSSAMKVFASYFFFSMSRSFFSH